MANVKTTGEPIFYQQYITQVSPPRVVWIKQLAEVWQYSPWNGEERTMVNQKYYWADAVSGPYEELTDQPVGFHPVSFGVSGV